MGQTGCPETSVRNYHHLLRSNPEVRSSQHFTPLPICLKMFHSQYYLVATILEIQFLHSQICVCVHTFFTI